MEDDTSSTNGTLPWVIEQKRMREVQEAQEKKESDLRRHTKVPRDERTGGGDHLSSSSLTQAPPLSLGTGSAAASDTSSSSQQPVPRLRLAKAGDAPPAPWKLYQSQRHVGRFYFYNEQTGEKNWEIPDWGEASEGGGPTGTSALRSVHTTTEGNYIYSSRICC